MSPHPRQLVRSAISTAILNKTTAQARVYRSRTSLHRARELPMVGVYTLSETIREDSLASAPRYYIRLAQVQVVGAIEGRNEDTLALGSEAPSVYLDDQLDDMALAIEKAVLRDDSLGGLVRDIWLVSTEVSFEERAEKTVGMVTMTFTVEYETLAPIEDDDLDAFLTADIRTDLEGVQADADQSHDVVTLEQD